MGLVCTLQTIVLSWTSLINLCARTRKIANQSHRFTVNLQFFMFVRTAKTIFFLHLELVNKVNRRNLCSLYIFSIFGFLFLSAFARNISV